MTLTEKADPEVGTTSPPEKDADKTPQQPEVAIAINVGGETSSRPMSFFAHVDSVFLNKDSGVPRETPPLSNLLEPLPGRPPHLHEFQDPRHSELISILERKRILLLTSYLEKAAYSAAFAVVHDEMFASHEKLAFSPTRTPDKGREDLDVMAITAEGVLGERRVLLIEIGSRCSFLDALLDMDHFVTARTVEWLQIQSSCLVLVINEDLLADKAATNRARETLDLYVVSHLRYLLTRYLDSRASVIEVELASYVQRGLMAPQEMYHHVEARLMSGIDAFEAFLADLRRVSSLSRAEIREHLQPIDAEDILREPSEVHRVAAFVGTFFPALSQREFERLVLLLLGGETTTVERTRQALGSDGSAVTIHEEITERWADRWRRSADTIFRDCHLSTSPSEDGVWTVSFSEPYLGEKLRRYFERSAPWYFRAQCAKLQESGALFFFDLSLAAVEGLVGLFVERALADPSDFGSPWLLEMVHGLRIELAGEPSSESPEETLKWMLEKLAEAQLRAHFLRRLAFLLREMLEREGLRPRVHEFLSSLIQSGEHSALLDLVL
ncbi:MAG: hypothetical protein SF066_07025, partial [Thermoanaerobaculia bacterium]|nr:hypothetical protein [Thermoanaerobaculia bacterium]